MTKSFSERFAKQARDLIDAAGVRTGQLARIGRLQLDILGIQRERNRELQVLGERALDLVRRGECGQLETDPVAVPILRHIAELDAEKIDREAQIEEVRVAAARESGRQPGNRYEEGRH